MFELPCAEEGIEDWDVEGEEEDWPHPASIRVAAVHPKMDAATSNIFFFFTISLQMQSAHILVPVIRQL